MFLRNLLPYIYFIFCGFILQVSYQQSFVGPTTKPDLTFCIENHTMSNTLQTFWHDANSDCELEPRRLLAIYSQLLDRPDQANKDHCSILLSHHIRKQLIQILATKFEEYFITQPQLDNNSELKSILNDVHKIDNRVAQAVVERAINEIYLFVKSGEIIEKLMQWNSSEEIQVLGLQYFLSKYQMQIQRGDNISSILAYYLTKLRRSKTLPNLYFKTIFNLYHRLPRALRDLYSVTPEIQPIRLQNKGHWEYLYAPRDNGPDGERRTPLTWSKEKNYTDSDGDLLIQFNSKGLVAIGSRYGASIKYLYADDSTDEHSVYFWIGHDEKASRWWHVISMNDLFPTAAQERLYFIIQNNDTQDLLCATTEYDENRRYVTLLNESDNRGNEACHWVQKISF